MIWIILYMICNVLYIVSIYMGLMKQTIYENNHQCQHGTLTLVIILYIYSS